MDGRDGGGRFDHGREVVPSPGKLTKRLRAPPPSLSEDMFPIRRKLFRNRRQAGLVLAARLAEMELGDVVVIALPRGGVPVGFEVAKALRAPLDVGLVRKLGHPNQPELGLGAI